MRAISDVYNEILKNPLRKVKYKVEIKDSNGTWRDLTDLLGQDWVSNIQISADIDSPVMDATIEFKPAPLFYLSLNPLVQSSAIYREYGELIREYARIRVLVKIITNFEPDEWINIFEGYIDEVSIRPNNSVSVRCRDLGGRLQDTWIEEERVYGTDEGIPVYQAMQDILDDNESVIGYTVTLRNTMTSDIWYVKKWKQERTSVLDALQALADQIGWSVRYLWNPSVNEWQLTFYCIDRTATTPLYTFYPDTINEFESIDRNISGVRNVIKVVYFTSPDAEPSSVVVSDATSVTKYGRRFMEIKESNTSHINTEYEATKLANNCLRDLKDVKATCSISVPLFPFVELGDLYKFLACSMFDQDMNLAVTGFRHVIESNSARTELLCRLTPAGSYYSWFEHSTQFGSPVPTIFPVTPKINGAVQVGKTLKIYLEPITDRNFDHFEIHLSKEPNFTPSVSTLIAISSNPIAELSLLSDPDSYNSELKSHTRSLGRNVTGYLKVIAVDKFNNRSEESNEFEVTPSGFLSDAIIGTATNIPVGGTDIDISSLGLQNAPVVIAIPTRVMTYSSSSSSFNQEIRTEISKVTNERFHIRSGLYISGSNTYNINQTISLNGTYESPGYQGVTQFAVSGTTGIKLICQYFPGGPGPYHIRNKIKYWLGYSSTQNGVYTWDEGHEIIIGYWFDDVVGYYHETRTYSQNYGTLNLYISNPQSYYWKFKIQFISASAYTAWDTINDSNTFVRISSYRVDTGSFISGADVTYFIFPKE